MKKTIKITTKKPFTFTLDTLAQAIYIKLSDEKVFRTERKGNCLIDYNDKNEVVGIEFIRIKQGKAIFRQVIQRLPKKNIPSQIKETLATLTS